MGKIYARQIHDGLMTLDQVPENWVEATKTAYQEIYGEPIPETNKEEKPVSGGRKRKKK